jgi:hypothetical protein
MLKLFFILLFSLTLQAQTIAEIWESSAEYKEYVLAMERREFKSSSAIKQKVLEKIIKHELKDYLSDFNDKYRVKYTKKLSKNLQPILLDFLKTTHVKLSPLIPKNNLKMKHDFVKYLYRFTQSYMYEDGNAQKELYKLFTKTPQKIQNTQIAISLKQMAIDSDTEAAKSPEQKRKELEKYIAQKNKEIAEEKRKQAEEKRKQKKWREIIKKLNSL